MDEKIHQNRFLKIEWSACFCRHSTLIIMYAQFKYSDQIIRKGERIWTYWENLWKNEQSNYPETGRKGSGIYRPDYESLTLDINDRRQWRKYWGRVMIHETAGILESPTVEARDRLSNKKRSNFPKENEDSFERESNPEIMCLDEEINRMDSVNVFIHTETTPNLIRLWFFRKIQNALCCAATCPGKKIIILWE